MRNILKATTLESKLPLLAVEHGCIISKDADITVCYEVTLPELFTVTSQEYLQFLWVDQGWPICFHQWVPLW